MKSSEATTTPQVSCGHLLSIIVPCADEAANLRNFYDAVIAQTDTFNDTEIEFRFIDDGSQDNTIDILNSLHDQDPRVHYLSFSRRFGKEAAMLAGLQAAKGDLLVIMDADLQDPPELLPQMHNAICNEGYDCIATRRTDRAGEPFLRSVCARTFYWIMSKCAQCPIVSGARDFRMMNRPYADAILSLPEYNRFSKGIFNWVGFKVKWLEFQNRRTEARTSRWSFRQLCAYAIDGIIAFSAFPLLAAFGIGLIAFLFASALGIKTIINTLFFNEPVRGYTTIIVCITFFAALQFLFFGVIGLYISKIYMEVKKRPVYIIAKEL